MPVTSRSGYVGALMDEYELEHANKLLHRHRRQIERWLAEAT